MTKSVYEILASKVVDTVEAIKDPVEKAKAIGKFMEILKDKDVEGVVTPIKVKAAKQQEEKAAAAEAEIVKEMDGTYDVKPKKASKVEKPSDVLNLPKSEPLEMIKPNKEKVEAIKAKIEEAGDCDTRGPQRNPATAQPLAALPLYGCGVLLAGTRFCWGR